MNDQQTRDFYKAMDERTPPESYLTIHITIPYSMIPIPVDNDDVESIVDMLIYDAMNNELTCLELSACVFREFKIDVYYMGKPIDPQKINAEQRVKKALAGIQFEVVDATLDVEQEQ